MATAEESKPSRKPERPDPVAEPPRAGPILATWMAVAIVAQGAAWVAGARATAVGEAIETGAAKVETRGVGELGDEVVRKAINLQHDTRPFWTAMALLGDFAGEPLALALRAASVATLFAAIALLKGRPVGFAEGLARPARVPRACGSWGCVSGRA